MDIAALRSASSASLNTEILEDGLPADLNDDERAVLLIFPGQLIQTTKQRPDGWAFGKVIFDEEGERGPAGDDFTDGLRWRDAGRVAPEDSHELSSASLASAFQADISLLFDPSKVEAEMTGASNAHQPTGTRRCVTPAARK